MRTAVLNSRNTVITILIITAVSIAYTVYDLATPPDAGGLGANSYGTRGSGHRALYETLEHLIQTPSRSHFPPPAGIDTKASLIMIGPIHRLTDLESEHLITTAEWVKQGGHLVLALEPREATCCRAAMIALGIDDIDLQQITPNKVESKSDLPLEQMERERAHLLKWKLDETRKTVETDVQLTGPLQLLAGDVKRLRLPADSLSTLDASATGSVLLTPMVLVADDEGVSHTLAGSIEMGDGTITLIADDSMFNNFLLGVADNSVLAVNLAAWREGPIYFDEFFHGLSSRGNPLWLLTRPHYGWLCLILLVGTGLWVWRQWVALGPPLAASEPSRRTLAEYLDAMAALFTRSRKKLFVLQELRAGVLWSIRQELHLPPGSEDAEILIKALSRQQPDRARQLEQSVRQIDVILNDRKVPDHHTFTELAREISRCL